MLLSSTFQSWRDVFIGILTGLVVAIPAYIKLWLDRKKPVLETDESEARSDLARVTAQSVAIRDGIATGEGVGKMLASLIEAGETIREQSKDIAKLQEDLNEVGRQRDNFEWDWKHEKMMRAKAEDEAGIARQYTAQLHAAASLKNVSLADYSPLELKAEMERLLLPTDHSENVSKAN